MKKFYKSLWKSCTTKHTKKTTKHTMEKTSAFSAPENYRDCGAF